MSVENKIEGKLFVASYSLFGDAIQLWIKVDDDVSIERKAEILSAIKQVFPNALMPQCEDNTCWVVDGVPAETDEGHAWVLTKLQEIEEIFDKHMNVVHNLD